MVSVELAAALGVSEEGPVGGTVGGAVEAWAFAEGLEEDGPEGVALLPVVGEAACDASEEMGGEVGDADPGEDEEACVVDDAGEVALSGVGAPADGAVAGCGLPGGGAEAEGGEGQAVGGTDEVAHLGAGQGVVSEVVVAVDEGVPEVTAGGGGDGLEAQRPDRVEGGGRIEQRRRVGGGEMRDRPAAAGPAARRRQGDEAVAVHAQQGDACAHGLEPAVRLAPVEVLADGARQRGPVERGVALGEEGADVRDRCRREVPSAVAAPAGHAGGGAGPGRRRAARRPGAMLQGSQGRRSAGARPPRAAQASRYASSQ